jgi:hypothetical protein
VDADAGFAGDRRRDAVFVAVLAILFVALRAALAWSREPFFDELFSVWMARRPLSAILPALRYDSGPPFYYILARFDSVAWLRALSFAVSLVPFTMLLRERRWLPAMLLTVHPAAALFAVTARPYALCAAFVAIGVLLLERDRVWPAAAAFVAASYTHYYGVLFFPTLLFCRAPLKQRVLAGLAAGLTFLPALLLSLGQPREATAWMTAPGLPDVLSALAFRVDEHVVPLAVTLAAFALTVVAAARSLRHAGFVLVPLTIAVGLSFVRPAYFPVRFASVIAFPLVLWIAQSLAVWGLSMRRVLTIALALCGVVAIGQSVIEQASAPMDPYREAAIVLRRSAGPTETVVASGFLYLEAVDQLRGHRIRAFPREQCFHPGWRVGRRSDLSASELPGTGFLWIGERAAPEIPLVLSSRSHSVLFANERAVILQVGPLPDVPAPSALRRR